eukprot:sb/3461124/
MAPKRKPPTKRRKKSSTDEARPVVAPSTTEEEDDGSEKRVVSKLLAKMKLIMQSVQKGYTHQTKNIEKMWELKRNCNESGEEFFEEFWYLLQHACLVGAREPPTERIIQFCCKFAIRADLNKEKFSDEEVCETGPFAVLLFNRALQYHTANDKAVRFRLCQIINILLTSLGGDAEIDEELFDKIYSCMLERLKDKVPSVRVQAVHTLNRLQDPADPECPVIKGFLKIMKTDGVADVRRAAVKAIAINSKTLMPLIERTRDTNPGVRKGAYEVLVEKISIRSMKISYRMKIIESGLHDRHASVKSTCVALLRNWLAYYNGDIVRMLQALDVEGKVDLCGEVVKEVLAFVSMDNAVQCLQSRLEEGIIPVDQLTPESIFYWRCLVDYCLKNSNTETYDAIMPNLSRFAEYLKNYVVEASKISSEDYDAHYQASYIIQELIKMAKLADMSDEAGRKKLIGVTKFIITEAEITIQSIERLVELYCLAETDEGTRIRTVAEIINDIRNPLEGATQFNLNELDSCEKSDPVTMIRCLTMVTGLVQWVKCDVAFEPTLTGLLENVVMSGVVSHNEIVRHLSVKALGLSCILSKTLAKKYLVFFLQVVMVDNFAEILETSLKVIFDLFLVFGIDTFAEDEQNKKKVVMVDNFAEILETSLKVIFDLFLVFGIDTFAEDEQNKKKEAEASKDSTALDDESALSSKLEATRLKGDADIENPIGGLSNDEVYDRIIAKFKEFLDDEVLRSVAAEGVAKLIYNGRLLDPQLFSRLMLLWWSPATEGDVLRHSVGMFFSRLGPKNVEMLEMVEQAFFPTLQTVCDAPSTSPLQEINPVNLAELLLSLLPGRHHEQLSITACNELILRPSSKYGRALVKILPLFDILHGDAANLKLVRSLVQQAIDEVDTVSTKKSLTSYLSKMALFLPPEDQSSQHSQGEEEDKENQGTENKTITSPSNKSLPPGSTEKRRKALFANPNQPPLAIRKWPIKSLSELVSELFDFNFLDLYNLLCRVHFLEQAFFPTLQTVCDAPSTSPLQEINPVNLAELLLSLLPGRHHEQLSITACNELILRPSSKYGRALVKILPLFDILHGDAANLKLVRSLVQQAIDEVDTVSTKKSLTSYLSKMALFLPPEDQSSQHSQGEEEDKENQGTENKTITSPSVKSLPPGSTEKRRKALFANPNQPSEREKLCTGILRESTIVSAPFAICSISTSVYCASMLSIGGSRWPFESGLLRVCLSSSRSFLISIFWISTIFFVVSTSSVDNKGPGSGAPFFRTLLLASRSCT